MNNLKRVLSLALASVMLIGMMVVGASAADFTDADEIQHTEAVDILVALGIVNGKEDGSYFDPTGSVTRGEMAKMIAVAMKGGNDVNTGTKGVATFSDISGHWAESYIEYCYDLGIIAGRGDGTFDPNGLVTGTEVTKMVLTALGYDSAAYGLTGATWATRTDELARKADPQLFNELSGVTLNTPATRDTAAQIIWNGLQNDTREYAPDTNKSSGEITWTYKSSNKSMLKERYDGDVYTGTFTGNYYTLGSSLEKDQIRVDLAMDGNGNYVYTRGGKQTTQTNAPGTATFPADIDISYIGEEVKVIYKNGVRSSSYGPDKNDTIYGVFVTGTTNVINTTINKLEGKEKKSALVVDGAEYDLASKVTVIYNYAGSGKTYAEATGTGVTDNLGARGFEGNSEDSSAFTRALTGGANATAWHPSAKDGKAGKAGFPVKVILNDNNKVEKLYIVESKLSVVSAVSSSKVSLLNGVGTIDIDKNDIYDDIAKNDVVVVTTLYKTKATDDDAFSIVRKAEMVTGEVTGYKGDTKATPETTENVVVDGTTYKILTQNKDQKTLDGSFSDVTFTEATNSNLSAMLTRDAEVNVYLVNGYVAGIEKVKEGNGKYYVVTAVKAASNTKDTFTALEIEVLGSDGTKTVLRLHEDSHDDVYDQSIKEGGQKNTSANHINVGDLITYSMKSDGTANVTRVAKFEEGTPSEYIEDTKSVKVGSKTYVTASDAVLYVETGDVDLTDEKGSEQSKRNAGSYKAYTARSLKNVKNATGGVAYIEDGKVVAAFLDADRKASSSGSDAVFGIVSAVNGTERVDGTNYDKYTVKSGDETYTVLANIGSPWVAPAKGNIVYFTPKADNIYESADDLVVVRATSQKTSIVNSDDYAFFGYMKEYDAKGQIITYWDDATQIDANNWKGDDATLHTYALDKDATLWYVDADAKTATTSGSVTAWDKTAARRNVLVIYNPDGKVYAIISEQSGEAALKEN